MTEEPEKEKAPGEEAPEPEEEDRQDISAKAGLRQSTVLRNWRQRMARVRISAGSRPTAGAFSKVEESALRIRAAIRNIPDPTDRAILMLRIFNALSRSEVAQRLGIDEDEVGDRYRRCLRQLHDDLRDWLH